MDTFYNTLYNKIDTCSIHNECYRKMICSAKKAFRYMNDEEKFLYDKKLLLEDICLLEESYFKNALFDIVRYYKDYDLPFLQKNLSTLNVKNKKSYLASLVHKTYISGVYSPKNNKIVYDGDKYTLYHELMHVSSSTKNYSGFYNLKNFYGYALNEGFTEILTSNIFNNQKKSTGYDVETKGAFMIANLSDQDITSFYFNASLKKLYSTFSEEDLYLIVDLINLLDFYNLQKAFNKNEISYLKSLYYINAINETYMCLLINKYKDGYNKDILEYLTKHYKHIISKYDSTIMYTKDEYEDLSKKILKKFLR